MTVDEFPQAQVLGEGGRQEQAGIGHQAVVIKDDADPVGIVLWQHLLGAPCFQAVFCSKTIIPAKYAPAKPNMTLKSIRNSLIRHIRQSLVGGLLLLVPVAITYVIIRFLFDLVDGVLGPWIEWLLGQFGIGWTLPGPGVVAAVIIVYMLGAFATFGIGRMAVDWTRTALLRVPLIGTIYSANRQLIESFSGTSVTGFKRVVLVQFPRANAWSLGFLTGITDAVGGDRLIMTYVPTAPLPNSGFVVLMPPEDVLDTDLSVPEAMQLIFSGGIVSPRTIGTKKIDIGEVERQIHGEPG